MKFSLSSSKGSQMVIGEVLVDLEGVLRVIEEDFTVLEVVRRLPEEG